ncbi:MAG: hypothetical protein ACQ9ET_00275 [Nitrosomonadaceae bacterium]
MAVLDKVALFAAIDAAITTNGTNDITGAILNAMLKDFGDSDINRVTDLHLLGVADYDPTKVYNASANGVVVIESGLIYQAVNTSITGAFDPADWNLIGGSGWIKITKTHIDFQTAGLTNDIEVYELPAGWMLEGSVIKHTTSASGGSISSYNVGLGITGNFTKFVFSVFDVFQAVSATAQNVESGSFVENWDAVTSIRSQATSVGDNLDQSTTGSFEYYLKVSQVKS